MQDKIENLTEYLIKNNIRPSFHRIKILDYIMKNNNHPTVDEIYKAVAAQFRMVAEIEKAHEERYRALLKNVEMQKVFEKSEETMWEYSNCGHLVMGKKAPEMCPVCSHPKSFSEARKENY